MNVQKLEKIIYVRRHVYLSSHPENRWKLSVFAKLYSNYYFGGSDEKKQ